QCTHGRRRMVQGCASIAAAQKRKHKLKENPDMQASRWLRRLIAALPWLAAHAAALAQSTAALPMAPVRNVQDSHFGTVVDDPYRYFENVKDPEVAAWMKAQADHAQRVLGA